MWHRNIVANYNVIITLNIVGALVSVLACDDRPAVRHCPKIAKAMPGSDGVLLLGFAGVQCRETRVLSLWFMSPLTWVSTMGFGQYVLADLSEACRLQCASCPGLCFGSG